MTNNIECKKYVALGIIHKLSAFHAYSTCLHFIYAHIFVHICICFLHFVCLHTFREYLHVLFAFCPCKYFRTLQWRVKRVILNESLTTICFFNAWYSINIICATYVDYLWRDNWMKHKKNSAFSLKSVIVFCRTSQLLSSKISISFIRPWKLQMIASSRKL